MNSKTILDEEAVIRDYVDGKMGIHNLGAKYHTDHKNIRALLDERGIIVRTRAESLTKDKSQNVLTDRHYVKYPPRDGYYYLAVDKVTGEHFRDIENRGGFLTTHIRKKYNVEVPSLYKRQNYLLETGNYWWEQWLDVIEVEEKKVKKCPYCEWVTTDLENKSGAYTAHIQNEHDITIEEHLKNHPEDEAYLHSIVSKIKYREFEKDSSRFVVCPICGKKMKKITNTHLEDKHGMTFDEFKKQYQDADYMSKEQMNQILESQRKSNMFIAKSRYISKQEMEIREFLDGFGIQYRSNRQILIGKEIDILIDSHKIGIEVNGLKWHSERFAHKDKSYHVTKTNMCNEKGYALFHVFEDVFFSKKELVFSKIRHKLMLDTGKPKVAGRKLSVTVISASDGASFIEKYNIEGDKNADYYLGGYFHGELVAVMSFKNVEEGDWELLSIATKDTYVYQGVASKMFRSFVRDRNPKTVISYSNRNWDNRMSENVYSKMGFCFDSVVEPTFRYYSERIERHDTFSPESLDIEAIRVENGFPSNMSKDEILANAGYDKVWNCGQFAYKWDSGS